MATGSTNAKVVGMGDGGMQWVAPLQFVNGAGTVVASIDAAGAIVSASSVTGNSLIDASGGVALAGTLSVVGTSTLAAVNASGTVAAAGAATVGTTLGVTGASTLAGVSCTTLAASGAASFATSVAVSVETGLTAHAGGTQAAALALTATKCVHNVATVGTAADSVILPAATGSGQMHLIKNSAAANSLQLFAALTETIDGVASATGVAIAAGKSRLVIDIAAGSWASLLGA